MRPALPRTSSAASGLRFCGMIEEPVVKASESRTKPNCGVVQSTISSAKRERCTAQIEAAASVSSTKSRSETESSEFAVGRSKPSACRGHVAVDREGGAGERRRAERAFVEAPPRIREAAAVAGEHLDIGEEMVAEGDRLRRLQMREARHRRRRRRRAPSRRAPAAARRAARRGASIASRTQSRMSVATWSLRERAVCSRPAAGPMRSCEALSTFMWMSSSARENVKAPLSISAAMALSPRSIAVTSSRGRMPVAPSIAACASEPRMSWGAKPLVEIDGGVDLLHDLGGAGGETPAPHPVAHLRRLSLEAHDRLARPVGALLVGSLVAGLAVVGAALYGTLSGRGQQRRPRVPGRDAGSRMRLAPLARGEVAAVKVEPASEAAAGLSLRRPRRAADHARRRSRARPCS